MDVEIFVNCGFGYQVRCEAVCEAGSALIGDEHTMVVTAQGAAHEEVARDYTVRFTTGTSRSSAVIRRARAGCWMQMSMFL